MRKSATYALALALWSTPLAAQRSAAADSLLVRGVDAALRHDYDRARASFLEAARIEPGDPAGLVLAAGIIHQTAEDLSREFDRRTFDSLLTQAEIHATSGTGGTRDDVPLWRATARGMLSVVEANASEWMSAIRDALVSASEARELLGRDSSVIDAGLPMGNYLYWRSRKTEALQWLPFMSDDRTEGIRLLEQCASAGRYHRWAAVSSLIWILYDAGDLDRAERWARTGLARYPENRTFLAGLAKVLETKGDARGAASAWSAIAGSVRRDAGEGSYASFSAGVNELRCRLIAGDVDLARGLAKRLAPPSVGSVPAWLGERCSAKVREYDGLRSALDRALQPGPAHGGRR